MKNRIRSALALSSLALVSVALTAAPRDAEAFCGFYVAPNDAPLYADATMVALMREENRTALTMSNNYRGPAADFAMVVPVPVVLQKENVKTLKASVFQKLEALSAPRLVEYWEQDPCMWERSKGMAMDKAGAAAPASGMGYGGGGGKHGVTVEAEFTVGEYDIVILSAKESDGLETWLHENKYNVPKGAAEALAPYVKEQMKFFVAKVDVKKVTMDAEGVATLSPLRVHYESADFRLPLRLGLINAKDKQDLIVYILSKKGRYEAANYPNVFIPTNIDVRNETRDAFGPFYAELFDATMKKAGGKAVVTEYSWASGSCDPCPTPPLTDSDLATLGGDALLGMAAAPADDPMAPPGSPTGGAAPTPTAAVKGVSPGSPPVGLGGGGKRAVGPGGYFGGTTHMVTLTRLHTRYDKTSLGEDVVFRSADPVIGGREMYTNWSDSTTLEKGAKPATYGGNNFQARYAIRHPWTGPIECKEPRRGVWGGPPAGTESSPTTTATGLAKAPRGKVQLASLVAKPIPEVDVTPSNAGPIEPPPASIAKKTPRPKPVEEPSNPPSAWDHGGIGSGPAMWIGLVAALAVAGITFTIASRSRK